MSSKTDTNVAKDENAPEAKAETPEVEPGAETAEAGQAEAGQTVDQSAAGPPFDPTTIRIETRALKVDVLAQRLAEGGIDLGPPADGNPAWTAVVRSRLIESLLLRVPLPAFYFDASAPERWSVIDGQHRLAALDAFINTGAFDLCGLEFLDHLEGKAFTELPRHFQRRILETQVTGHLIQEGTPGPVRAVIVGRIRTGGRRVPGEPA